MYVRFGSHIFFITTGLKYLKKKKKGPNIMSIIPNDSSIRKGTYVSRNSQWAENKKKSNFFFFSFIYVNDTVPYGMIYKKYFSTCKFPKKLQNVRTYVFPQPH